MDTSTLPRTAAATQASILIRASKRAHDPGKREHALQTVGAGLAAGVITPDDIAEAERVATAAKAPKPDTVTQLRALLPALPSDSEAA